MKRALSLVMACMLAITVASAQTGWVDHKADERISIKFPADPAEVIAGTFVAKDKDEVAYVFTVVDFVAVANIDSVALAPIKNTAAFTDQLKVGMAQSLPDVTFDDFKIGTWKGFTSYTSTGVDSKKQIYDMFMILVGNKLYSLSTIRADGTSTVGRDSFFQSLTLQ
ncbi:hypothetical protein [Mucilaginibacter ginsenosidivorans]|uniref:Uncharacterized protein n=1 Tax=Mucilaginibacter ginsenosidivorans TaxID=398053 RepID=A0A5B8US15_9SPHI|nr:hypothetical protein [Mucilaginibacter ginsenosidivorans]QEC61191.1 hypothetical protein FRZ54_00865 [Mucilaginibacter ginsenosidivorans]